MTRPLSDLDKAQLAAAREDERQMVRSAVRDQNRHDLAISTVIGPVHFSDRMKPKRRKA